MKALSKGKEHAKVAQLFDPPLSQLTVATITKNEKQIISAYEGGMYKSKRKMLEESTYPKWIKHHQNGLKKEETLTPQRMDHYWQKKLGILPSNLTMEMSRQTAGF